MVESADPTALTHALAAIRSAAPSLSSSSSGGGAASTVAVSNLPACQQIAAAALPLPAGAAQDGTDGSGITGPTGGVGIRGWLSGIFSRLPSAFGANGGLKVDAAGSALPVALSGITNVTVSNFPAAQTVAGSVTANTGTLPSLVKGTQGTTGFTVQDVKDAGRVPVILSAMAVPSVTSEAMFTLNKWVNGAVTSGTSYTVSAGKTLRVQGIQYGCRFAANSTTVTFASTKINFRSGAAITSPLIYGDSKMAAANLPTPNSDLPVPDGMEFPAGTVLGFSHVDSATTLLLDVVLVGFEY